MSSSVTPFRELGLAMASKKKLVVFHGVFCGGFVVGSFVSCPSLVLGPDGSPVGGVQQPPPTMVLEENVRVSGMSRMVCSSLLLVLEDIEDRGERRSGRTCGRMVSSWSRPRHPVVVVGSKLVVAGFCTLSQSACSQSRRSAGMQRCGQRAAGADRGCSQAHDFRRSARGATHLVKPLMPFAAVGDPPVEDQRPKDGAQNLSTIHPLRTGRRTG